MRHAIIILFYLLAIIHILPAVSALSSNRLANLYGISAQDNQLMTLLQHRAVLFALVAAACIYAAHTPAVRWAVLIGTVISMGSFIVIAIAKGTSSGALSKIVAVDAAGLLIAAIAAFLIAKG